MMSAALDDDMIDRVREAASTASSVDEILERIAAHLPEELAVSRVGLRVYDPEHDFVSVAKARTCGMRVVGEDPVAPPVLQDMLGAELSDSLLSHVAP